MTQFVITKKNFKKEKKISEDDKQVTFKGHYGGEFVDEFGLRWNFYWGNGTRSYSKNKKWNKKLRYVKNKGFASKVVADMALGSTGPPGKK